MIKVNPIVLVVDDDRKIRTLLSKYLKNHNFIILEAQDAKEAIDIAKEVKIDLAIIDYMMPGKNGFELTTEFKQSYDFAIILLTAINESEKRIEGLESGADDYLAKPFEPRELVLRIEKILNRPIIKQVKQENLHYFGSFTFDISTYRLMKNDVVVSLTTTESRLISVFIENEGVILSREKLSQLAGGVNDRSIDVQIIRLRTKIESDPKNPYFVKSVRGKGYIFHS